MSEKNALTPSSFKLWTVTAFLGLLAIAGMIIFGLQVLWVVLVSLGVATVIESAFVLIRGKKHDASIFITPLIFAMLVPPIAPLWMVGIGAGFAAFFGKGVFGGYGRTVFNPALVGIIFVTVSFPRYMTTQFLNPVSGEITTTTPLMRLLTGQDFDYEMTDLLFGNVPGMIGATFAIGIVALGILMLVLKIIDWRIVTSLLLTYLVLGFLGYILFPDTFIHPLYAMVVGTFLLGTFFVATDPITATLPGKGRFIYGFGIAFLTLMIRVFTAFPEGIVFAIVLMNAIAPLIDEKYHPLRSEEGEVPA